MSPLRNRRLGRRWGKRPELWLGAVLLVAILFAADATRAPQHQVSVRLFAASVGGYHRFIHPLTGRFIRCRYSPTCSEYSVEAVRKYGIAKGGWMGLRRIVSCTPKVPMGTVDPVP
jgi:uncharacterized protein